MKRYFVVALGVAVVIGAASTLLAIVLRSPDTHANLWNGVKPGYERTPIGVVGEAAVYKLPGLSSGQAFTDRGQQVYLLAGCANCHGVGARGGVVGPVLTGAISEITIDVVREGPYGMPAYPEEILNDSDIESLATYLAGLPSNKPSEAERASLLQLTYTPYLAKDILLKGKVALRKNCGACHEIPTKYPGDYSLNGGFELGPLLEDMVKETNLTLDDARLVGYYILAVRNGVEPVLLP